MQPARVNRVRLTTEYANAVSNEDFRMCRIVRITRAGLSDPKADVETILDHTGREEGDRIAAELQRAYDRGHRDGQATR